MSYKPENNDDKIFEFMFHYVQRIAKEENKKRCASVGAPFIDGFSDLKSALDMAEEG